LNENNISKHKVDFLQKISSFVLSLRNEATTIDGQWTIKGFIDIYKNVYTISSDTKIISKILEIHLFPKILIFAESNDYQVVLTDHQNYYPDMSFIKKSDKNLKFALDIKTTYRIPDKHHLCNGFTLGSHGKYFIDRTSTKNIQFPYGDYAGHFCFGIIYDRVSTSDLSVKALDDLDNLQSITSVAKNFEFFIVEKWKIASDKRGSGNTANIGSINNIDNLINGHGMFSNLGEAWFDDYWVNYGRIIVRDKEGKQFKINTLKQFVEYRKGDISLIVDRNSGR
jgi:hypothetical protein